MELALSGTGQMVSRDGHWNSLGFRAGSERRGRNSNDWIISLST